MRKEAFKFAVLLSVAIGAGPASAALWQWSKTAANNATADPTINFSEGMSPSSVNDSARALMAAVASNRDDISGLLTTAGTASAYTVTTNQGLQTPTPTDGQMISVTMNLTNSAGATLAADGGTAYPIQSSAGVAVGSGVLIAGSPYTLKYSAGNSAWMLRDFFGQPYAIPLGLLMEFTGTTSPNSDLIMPYGQCISRTTYATYFAMVGTTYGACDGTTTFAVIDKRGVVSAGKSNMGGVDRNNLTGGATLGNGSTTAFGAQTRSILQNQLPNASLPVSVSGNISVNSAQALVAGSVNSSVGINNGVFPYDLLSPGSAAASVRLSTGANSMTGSTTSMNGGVAQQAITTQQPTVVVNYLLRIR